MRVQELVTIVDGRYGDYGAFTANVRRWLWENDISQLRLAEEIGCDPSNLNRWLRGRVAPGLRNMMAIDEALERLLEAKEAQNV